MTEQDDDEMFSIITKPSIFIAVTPASNFSGTSPNQKKKIIDKLFVGKRAHYTGAAPHYFIHHKIEYVQIYFDNAEGLNACIRTEFKNKEDQPFYFHEKNTIKTVLPPEEQQLRDECTIQVINIPLNVTKSNISGGEIILPYIPPHPPKGTKYHRYTLAILEQPNNQKIQVPENMNRVKDVREFMSEYSLTLRGASFFREVWDKDVSSIYTDILGTFKIITSSRIYNR